MDALDLGVLRIASGHHDIRPRYQCGRAVHDSGHGFDDEGQLGSDRAVSTLQQPLPAHALGQGSGYPVRGRHDGHARTAGEGRSRRCGCGRSHRNSTRPGGTHSRSTRLGSPAPEAPAREATAPEAPAAAPPKQKAEATRVELTINSLRNYELIKPIPVFVESLGDRHYVAEVPDANISTSASNLSEILIILKDSVTQTYDKLRIRKDLDKEQARQLKVLETYIGRSRRSWLDRR